MLTEQEKTHPLCYFAIVNPHSKQIETDAEIYSADRYAEGVSAVYGSKGVITIAIVHNRYSPSNFW